MGSGSGSGMSTRRVGTEAVGKVGEVGSEDQSDLSVVDHVTGSQRPRQLSSPSGVEIDKQSGQSSMSEIAYSALRLGSSSRGGGSVQGIEPSLSTGSRQDPTTPALQSSLRYQHVTRGSVSSSVRGSKRKPQGPIRGQGSIINWLQKSVPISISSGSSSPANSIQSQAQQGTLSGIESQARSERLSTCRSGNDSGSGSGSGSVRNQYRLQGLEFADTIHLAQWGPVYNTGEDEAPIAVRLARQLWQFNGCRPDQHQQQQSNLSQDNNCHSLAEITSLLDGSIYKDNLDRKVPNILGQGDQLLSRNKYQVDRLDWRAMFEGRPSPDPRDGVDSATATATDSPWCLGLDKWHHSSGAEKVAIRSFDIDSLCAFPTSLGIAKLGIEWLPRHYKALQLQGSVHLGLEVKERDGAVAQKVWRPLHQIRHHCFGTLVGMPLSLYLFYPEYDFWKGKKHDSGNRLKGTGGSGSVKYSTTLNYADEALFLDQILLPALHEILDSSNIIQHFPTSAAQVKVNARALAKEQYVKGERSREQIISYNLQPLILDQLWENINHRIATATDPAFCCFRGLTLFLNGKNSKTHYMDHDFSTAMSNWRDQWAVAVDPAFINRRLTYVDLGKQITSPDTQLLDSNKDESFQAETYLYRKCCLDSVWEWFRNPGSSVREKKPSHHPSVPSVSTAATATPLDNRETLSGGISRSSDSTTTSDEHGHLEGLSRTYYPWATLRDTGAQTIATAPSSQLFQHGYIYGQWYNLIKGPFDSTKLYVFQSENIENLALDPAYIETLKKAGGADSFSIATATASYLHSKERASINLKSREHISHGIREEHRISLELFDQICVLWQQWEDLEDSRSGHIPISPPLPLPQTLPHYYTFTNRDILGFLHAQLNKYCLLFEHVLSQTNQTHSLPEFLIMVLALRSLRFSYSSSILIRESLLYKDEWSVMKNDKEVKHSGIGMAVAMAKSGIGWYLPKINWATFRILPPFSDRLLAGNLLLYSQYRRRWRAVRDLRDVYIRLGQIDGWAIQYQISKSGNENRREAWLDFLIGLNLNQFDHDTATAMWKSHLARPELAYVQPDGPVTGGSGSWMAGKQFCYRDLRKAFQTDNPNDLGPPHTVTSNKGRFKTTQHLVDFLFEEVSGYTYSSWKKMTYRMIYKKTKEVIKRHLGEEWQCQWVEDFKFLLLLTHWVLPYASPQSFISLTKTNRNQEKTGRACWYSAVYQEPVGYMERSYPTIWPKGVDRSLQEILRFGQKNTPGLSLPLPFPEKKPWQIAVLLETYAQANLTPELLQEYSILGRRQDGVLLEPVWERGRPPLLDICERIRDRTLDELEQVFLELISGSGGIP